MSLPLQLVDISQHHGERKLFSQLNLSLQPGESVALVGANGVGKTSLLKSILNFLPLPDGQIRIFGVDSKLPAARRELAYLPERFVPPQALRGNDFLDYAADLYHMPRDLAQRHALAEQLALEPSSLQQPVRRYSKGMSQKLGLLAVLLSGRRLLLLDEPMSGLDPLARARLKQQLTAYCAAGHSLLFTTHLLADVDQIADRMAILHAGSLQFLGAPAACKQQFQCEDLERAYLRCIDAL